MRKQTTFALVGAGKLTFSTARGLENVGYNPRNIKIIGRPGSDLSPFKKLGMNTSINMRDALNTDVTVILVRPENIADVLVRMKEAGIKKQDIISFVSGSNYEDISEFLDTSTTYVANATTNVNIEYGEGIICIAGNPYTVERIAEPFIPLGKIILETPDQVLSSVTTVGAGAGIHFKSILLAAQNNHKVRNGSMTLRQYLERLQKRDFFGLEDMADVISSHLQGEVVIFEEYLGYKNMEKAKARVLETFKSCVSTLLKIKKVNFEIIESQIKKVATKGGCTEKGLEKMKDEESLYFRELLGVFSAIHLRTQEFPKEVKSSMRKLLAA